MTTIILGDSRLKGIKQEAKFNRSNVQCHVKPGSTFSRHKKYVRHLKNKHRQISAFIVCLGVNDIPENIATLSKQKESKLFISVTKSIKSLVKKIKKHNDSVKVLIATIPPKDLKRSVEKYPQKASLTLEEITSAHQKTYEDFVSKINNFINDINAEETGVHLPLHVDLRIHRGRRGSSFYYHKLYDGLHPDDDLKTKWFDRIYEAYQKMN